MSKGWGEMSLDSQRNEEVKKDEKGKLGIVLSEIDFWTQ